VGSDQIWKDIVGEVDKDGDGVVDFGEFKDMMAKILVQETIKKGGGGQLP
jgi:Ca2+-binding EF-hand superfamily protein